MNRKKSIRLVVSTFMAVALLLLLPCLSTAGSLEPPPHAVDGSGNPVPTLQPKIACRGEFFINNDGTVTDCKTGLIWMRDANCLSGKTWSKALDSCSTLTWGTCGVVDRTKAGDWHLPTIEELKTLSDRNYSNPALSNAKGDGQWTSGDAFYNVQSGFYWSATGWTGSDCCSWGMDMGNGDVYYSNRANYQSVWCVRGGSRIK